jgi:hypothetical protein
MLVNSGKLNKKYYIAQCVTRDSRNLHPKVLLGKFQF